MQRVRDIPSILRLIAGSLACAIGSSAEAMGPPDSGAPVSRLVENLAAYTAEHPGDADGWYALARTHASAYTWKNRYVPVTYSRLGPIANDANGPVRKNLKAAADAERGAKAAALPFTDAELRDHLRAAILGFNRAIAIAPDRAIYRLGLASVLEGSAALAGELDVAPLLPEGIANETDSALAAQGSKDIDLIGAGDTRVTALWLAALRQPESPRGERPRRVNALLARRDDQAPGVRKAVAELLRADWTEQAAEQYFVAYSLALPLDSKISRLSEPGLQDLITFEAGTAYVRIVEARGARTDESVRLATVRSTLKAMKELPPPRGIEPLILSIDRAHSLAALVAPEVHSSFDLDGTGRPQRWTWVKPDAGILCWDPEHTGAITSGRQLFGSVTWWIFFENGYRALDALDDNRDGELRGMELSGLALWFDRNSNGVSDPGEVLPIESTGIAAISCRATDVEDGCAANLRGLTMADGRVLPTYDWVATSVEPSRPPQPVRVAGIAAAVLYGMGTTLGVVRRRRVPSIPKPGFNGRFS